MEFHLSFPDGDQREPEVFKTDVVRIGTGQTNDVVVSAERYPMVDRIHAELVAGDRHAWVYDNDSSTGTWVDGERVQKARLVQSGQLTIGENGLNLQVFVNLAGPKTRMIRRDQSELGITTVMRMIGEESGVSKAGVMGATRAIRKVVKEQSRTFRIVASCTIGFLLLVFWGIGLKVYNTSSRLGTTEQVLEQTEKALSLERRSWTDKMSQHTNQLDQMRQGHSRNKASLDRQLTMAQERARKAAAEREKLRKLVLAELAEVDSRAEKQKLDLRRRVVELRQKHDSHLSKIEALQTSLSHVRKKIADPFARIIERYGDAIFIIGLRSDTGKLVALGTGFAIREDGVLATNAHVTHEVMNIVKASRKLGRAIYPVAVMNKHPEKVYRIIDSVIHPDWQYGKVRTRDVSLLRLDMRAQPLPVILSVATRSQLRRFKEGQPIALIGFPGEVNDPYSPIATFKRGDVGRITTLEKSQGAYEEMILIQHSAPATPGNSGSPILDTEGRVVAIHNSGISIRFLVERRRVSFRPATGINWGLRADVILDLLENY